MNFEEYKQKVKTWVECYLEDNKSNKNKDNFNRFKKFFDDRAKGRTHHGMSGYNRVQLFKKQIANYKTPEQLTKAIVKGSFGKESKDILFDYAIEFHNLQMGCVALYNERMRDFKDAYKYQPHSFINNIDEMDDEGKYPVKKEVLENYLEFIQKEEKAANKDEQAEGSIELLDIRLN